jgi:hypothetical protein
VLSVCQDPRVHAFRLNGSLVLEIDLRGDARASGLRIHDRLHRRRDLPERRRGGDDGLRAALRRRATGESVSLMQHSGNGTVWFAKEAMDILGQPDRTHLKGVIQARLAQQQGR